MEHNPFPNLDGMTQEDLNLWLEEHIDYPDAAELLITYAEFKLEAMNFRKAGGISEAMRFEKLCDKIYAQLPGYARW